MKHPILGVIGGLGPESGCSFLLGINSRIKALTGAQPHILLDNLPISRQAEKELINGGASQEHLDLLVESVCSLNRLGADLIVIPCNTVHVFIDKLRSRSDSPILSIIEETVRKCREMNLMKVGILASTKTIESGLYSSELRKSNISSITPDRCDQSFVSDCIIRTLNNTTGKKDREILLRIAEKLMQEGAEAIILACTELPLLFPDQNGSMLIVNTARILEDAATDFLVRAVR